MGLRAMVGVRGGVGGLVPLWRSGSQSLNTRPGRVGGAGMVEKGEVPFRDRPPQPGRGWGRGWEGGGEREHGAHPGRAPCKGRARGGASEGTRGRQRTGGG